MPKVLDDCVKSVTEKGDVDNPYAVCIARLRDSGIIKQDGNKWVLTEKGRKRAVVSSILESSKCAATVYSAVEKTDITEKFSSFMKDLVRVSKETFPPEIDRRFKDLKTKYADYLPKWRETLEPHHKGLFLCVEDLDKWNGGDLKTYLGRLVDLYSGTVAEAVQAGVLKSVVSKHVRSL